MKTPVKIDTSRHEKMKELARKNNRTIIDEYREAIDNHILFKNQEILAADTKLEEFINNRVGKSENRLAGLSARIGMDTSIVLMGVTLLLSKLMKVDRHEIYEMLRKEAAQYFSRPYREQREE